MTTVFICYGRENQEQVRSLAQDLEDLGRVVWFDQALTGGQVWWDQILKKIRECDVFVFALAPLSLESQACNREYNYAAKLGKTILPVVVAEGVSDALLPEALAKIQYVDYQRADKAALRKLAKALNALPPSGPLPDPLPDPPAVPVSYLVGLREQIETSEHLSFEQQTSIVLRLKQRLHEAKEVNQVTDLLRRLRSRDDLYAKVGDEIDSLLRGATSPPIEQIQREEKGEPAAPAEPRDTSVSKITVQPQTPPARKFPIASAERKERKAVEERQTLFDLLPTKTVWLSLLIGVIFNGVLMTTIAQELWGLPYILSNLGFWENSLVFTAVLLAGRIVWEKVATKPLSYKITFFWAPPCALMIFVLVTMGLGLVYYDSSDHYHMLRFWIRSALVLFVLLFFVVIGLWKDTPSAPVPLKFLLAWLVAGLACAILINLSAYGVIIFVLTIMVSVAVALFVLAVSWRSLMH